MRSLPIECSGDDLLLSVDWRWFLVILRRNGCRQLVSFDSLPVLQPGQSLDLTLRIISPVAAADQVTTTLWAPGLGVRKQVQVPGSFALEVPENVRTGWHIVTLDGPGVLGHKRFVEVKSP